MASRSNLSMMGGSVPGGRRARMVLTLSRTSCAAMSRLRSRRNCTVICDTPSVVTLLSSSMLWMVLMISSSGLVTLVSISSGEAPRRVVVTVMTGNSTLGNWSMPMSFKQNQPSTTRNRLIIVANTGRLMQRSARPTPLAGGRGGDGAGAASVVFMTCGHPRRIVGHGWRRVCQPGRLARLDRHGRAIGQTTLAGHDHLVAEVDPVEDLLEPVANASGLHGATAGAMVFHDEHLGHAGKAHHRFERHDGRGRAALEHQNPAGKRVGLET